MVETQKRSKIKGRNTEKVENDSKGRNLKRSKPWKGRNLKRSKKWKRFIFGILNLSELFTIGFLYFDRKFDADVVFWDCTGQMNKFRSNWGIYRDRRRQTWNKAKGFFPLVEKWSSRPHLDRAIHFLAPIPFQCRDTFHELRIRTVCIAKNKRPPQGML